MTKIIDNSKQNLASVLNNEMSHVEELAIASAYFNLQGHLSGKQTTCKNL